MILLISFRQSCKYSGFKRYTCLFWSFSLTSYSQLVTPPTGFKFAVGVSGLGIEKSESTTLPLGRISLPDESFTSVVSQNLILYETTEVKDSSGRLILPKGKVVDSDFSIPNPDTPTANLNPVGGVTNYEYEVRKNDEKRQIFVLKPDYLQLYLNDMRRIMKYEKSSQYINKQLAATENTRNTSPE